MRHLFAGLALVAAACGAPDQALIKPAQISGDAIPAPLTSTAGNADRGKVIFVDRDAGHCVLCHAVSDLDVEFQGDIGPDLSLVGARLSAGQLRLRIVDYQIVRPGTLMPSYFRIHDLHQVETAFAGETILSAQDIEDIVAYLAGQRMIQDEE